MKKNKLFLIIIIISFFMTGCYSKEEKELAKSYRKQGKINAINYVKEKYNFNAKVKSVIEESVCDSVWQCLDSTPTGNVEVKLNANNKDFYVYVTGKYESTEAIDDYQFRTIEKDVIDFFRDNIPLDLYDYTLDFNTVGINEYYNNNLDDIISYVSKIELYYIGANDLDKLDIKKIQEKFKNHTEYINIINFKTSEECKAYKKAKLEIVLSSENIKNIYKSSMLTLYQGQKTFYKYDNITNYKDNVYVYPPQDDNEYKISLTNLDDLSHYKELYSELSDKKIVQVTNAYSIPASNSFLYIYFPMNKVQAKKSEKIFFASECNVNGIKKYFIESYSGIDSTIKIGTIGNYYIEQVRYSQCDTNSVIKFALIKIDN